MDNIEQKVVTVEHEILYVKVKINKDHLDSVKVYADMIRLDEDSLLEQIMATGIKTIRGQINNLPYASTSKLIKRYHSEA
ncbi:MAG: hypothetical protein PHH85_03430 [Candidatus Methanoperedens sp.]|nr:hypothetical protein [Candidatus Methanoperedens sp.]